jgi:hypothetical protein
MPFFLAAVILAAISVTVLVWSWVTGVAAQ